MDTQNARTAAKYRTEMGLMRALYHPRAIMLCNLPDLQRAQSCKAAPEEQNCDDTAGDSKSQ